MVASQSMVFLNMISKYQFEGMSFKFGKNVQFDNLKKQ